MASLLGVGVRGVKLEATLAWKTQLLAQMAAAPHHLSNPVTYLGCT